LNPKGFQVLIESKYPVVLFFTEEQAVELSMLFQYRAIKKIKLHYSDKNNPRYSASTLSFLFASYIKESKEQRIKRIKQELSNYWEEKFSKKISA
jgi:hypothetical protein